METIYQGVLDFLNTPDAQQKILIIGLIFATILRQSSVLYLKGIIGQAAQVNALPGWDSEIENWVLVIIGALASILTVFGSPLLIMIGVWLLIGIIYYALIRLMFHDLPKPLAWLLTALLFLIPIIFAIVAGVFGTSTATPVGGIILTILVMAIVALLTAALIAIIVAIYKAGRAIIRKLSELKRLVVGSIPEESDMIERPITTNVAPPLPEGTPVVGPAPGTPEDEGTGGEIQENPIDVPVGSCIYIDFNSSVLKDHLNAADLRISRAPTDQDITVDVSNDKVNWERCTRDRSQQTGFEDYDIPYWNSPFRYVRICNNGTRPVRVYHVYDLYK